VNIKRTFSERSTMANMRQMISVIRNNTKKYCSPLSSIPRLYDFKKNNALKETIILLTSLGYKIVELISNYQNKIIGLLVNINIDKINIDKINTENTLRKKKTYKNIFIPCYPSSISQEYNKIPKKYMDDDGIWIDYITTRDLLIKIHSLSNGKILCFPKIKVVEDKLIVGIITETNQFIQVDPPAENLEEEDEYIKTIYNSTNYIEADKILTSSSSQPDKERIQSIRKIGLEGQFYSVFRSTVRDLLNQFENREIKKSITSIFTNPYFLYNQKINKIVGLIKSLVLGEVVFNEIAEDVLNTFDEITDCSTSTCETAGFCLKKDNSQCSLIIPKLNLISGIDNEIVYFSRVADELVRYTRIRVFMTQPKNFLNITNSDYKIFENEIFLIHSFLKSEFFENNIPFSKIGFSKIGSGSGSGTQNYINNINYDIAEPITTQVYSNEPIPLSDQNQNLEIGKINQNLEEYILEVQDIIGNHTSLWKQIFPKKTKEIIFKHNSPQCSYSALIYVLQDKLKQPITISHLKSVLWEGYQEYTEKYLAQILYVLNIEGKKRFVTDIQNNKYNLETAINDEHYYLTLLDIWILAKKFELPICMFTSTYFKEFSTKPDWLLFKTNFKDKYYFIRYPIGIKPNNVASIHLLTGSYNMSELGKFENIVQTAVSGRDPDLLNNVQSLVHFLDNVVVKNKWII
jgi:hypothetical protein